MSSTKAGLSLGKTSIEKQADWSHRVKTMGEEIVTDMGDLRDYLIEQIQTELDGKITKSRAETLQKQFGKLMAVDWDALDGIEIQKEFHAIHSQSKAFFDLLIQVYDNLHLAAIPNLLGRHCGLSLYYRREMKPIKGMDLPKHLMILDHFPTSIQNAVAKHLKDAIYCYKQLPKYRKESVFQPLEEAWLKFVNPLINPTSGYKSTALYGQCEWETRHTDSGLTMLPISPNTGDVPWRKSYRGSPLMVSPSKDWFTKDVQALQPEDIVALFPPAELKVMMLLIGRALVGPNGSIPFGYPDVKIKHDFRTSVIIKGVPGTGKSQFLSLVAETMELFGYAARPFRSLDDRFGLGELAEASFIYKDDSSDTELSKLIHSSNFKTYVTGGYVCAEKKFKDATYIPARGVVVLCTNEWNPNNVYSVDEGIQSRLRVLETIDAESRDSKLASLSADHLWYGAPDLSPRSLINHLANKFDVAPEAIMARFLSHCAAYFYERMGELESTDKTLECQLVTRIPADPLLTTARAFKLVLALNGAYHNGRLTAMTVHDSLCYLYDLMFDSRSHAILDALKANWDAGGRDPRHPWTAFRDLSYSGVRTALVYSYHALKLDIETYRPNPQKMTSGSRDITLDVFLKAAYGHLHTWAGIRLNTSPAQIIKMWDEQRGYTAQVDKIVQQVGKHMPANFPGDMDDAKFFRLWWRPAMRPDEIKQARISNYTKQS